MKLRLICFLLFFCSVVHSKSVDLEYVLKTIDQIEPLVMESAQEVYALNQLINVNRLAFLFKHDQKLRELLGKESRQALAGMEQKDLIAFLEGITVYAGVDIHYIGALMEQITESAVKPEMAFFRGAIYSKKSLDAIDLKTANLLAHEAVHSLQEKGTIAEDGLSVVDTFLLHYIKASVQMLKADKPYYDNYFEMEAYDVAGRSWSYLNRHCGIWFM